jgi:hypothetical protein
MFDSRFESNRIVRHVRNSILRSVYSNYYLSHEIFFLQIFVLFVCDYDSSFFWSFHEWFRIWRHCRNLTAWYAGWNARLQEFDDLQRSKIALTAKRHEFDWARFKRIDRLLIKFVLELRDSENRLIKIKIWVKYKKNFERWSLISSRVKMIDEIQKNKSSIKARSSQIVLSSSDLCLDVEIDQCRFISLRYRYDFIQLSVASMLLNWMSEKDTIF